MTRPFLPTASEQTDAPAVPVELPVFSGPLELLLHLIRKNEVSIYDIPIATICDQYHRVIHSMQELDLDGVGEFLWMASWLLQLKSRMLLPRPVGDTEDPRAELVERLLEYRRVKELAALLYDRDVVRRCVWAVAAGTRNEPPPMDREVDLDEVDLRLLAQTYLGVMDRFASAHPPPLAVLPLRFGVPQKMHELYLRVCEERSVPLLRLLHGRVDIEEVVVLVVATLELVRLGGVCADQSREFAEIYLRQGSRQLDVDTILNHGSNDGS